MIKRLPHWVLTDNHPAFNDLESLTAIEMVARLYGKMQELVETYNKYVDDLNKAIDEFESGINSELEEYMNSVDGKLAEQDAEIADSITYVKNNIMDATNTIILEMFASGVVGLASTYDEENQKLTLSMTKDGGVN